MTKEVRQNAGPDGRKLDVELNGYMVPLPGLKTWLRQHGVTQTALGDLTGMHQSTVSNHLKGLSEMDERLVATLEELLTESETSAGSIPGAFEPDHAEELDVPEHLIGNAWDEEEEDLFSAERELVQGLKERVTEGLTLPTYESVRAKLDAGVTSFSAEEWTAISRPPGYGTKTGRFSAERNESNVPQEPLRVPVDLKLLSPFPVIEAQKIAFMARKAKEYRGTFSMRKLKIWGEVFYLLQDAGFSEEEAISGGFHMAAEAKTLPGSEDRAFLLGAFETVFTQEHRIPKPNANTARADGNRHPMDYLVEPLVRAGLPVWLVGESATGKTWSAKDIARRLGRDYLRIQGTQDTHEGDFMGGREVENATTYYSYGALPLAMRGGKTLIVDEVSLIPSGALMALQAVLEGEPLVIKANRGERVIPENEFGIVVTDNTRGLGEGLEFVGTGVVNESIRDRFAMIEYDYMPPGQERTAIEFHLSELMQKHGWGVKG